MAEAEQARRRWMAVLARASAEVLEACLTEIPDLPAWTVLRGPESGMMMVRGRVGGGGGAFNLGEMTVTRCTVRSDTGHVGHAYVAGRDRRHAELAAAMDALLQTELWHGRLHDTIIGKLAAEQDARRDAIAARAAATRVEFFTMQTMRGS